MALSVGLLVARRRPELEFLLAHPGGPFWTRKDLGAWSIPKGLLEPGEDPLMGARREFFEETGLRVEGPATPLHPVVLKSGKEVRAWLVEADPPLDGFVSNVFVLERPKGSGRMASFPEVDRIAWFSQAEALLKINLAQGALIRDAAARLR
jgi:predicted NUDIX family NTP pyrophosphohydrolase